MAASYVSKKGEIGVVAKVGEDFRNKIFNLTKRGIDRRGIEIVPNSKTARLLIKVHADGTRDFKVDLGAASTVDTHTFPEKYRRASYIHLATSYPSKYLKWLKYLKKNFTDSTIISADAVDTKGLRVVNQMVNVFEQVDLVFINMEELSNIKNAYPDFKLNKPMILKKGPLGAVYIDKENDLRINIPAPKVKMVDSTGAGDILAGVFLAKLAQGINIKNALTYAVNMASKSVSNFGVEHINPLVKPSEIHKY